MRIIQALKEVTVLGKRPMPSAMVMTIWISLRKYFPLPWKVKNGETVYERDSVIFDQIEYSWPVLTGLMCAAAQNSGCLKVLDFGCSLGSSNLENGCS